MRKRDLGGEEEKVAADRSDHTHARAQNEQVNKQGNEASRQV